MTTVRMRHPDLPDKQQIRVEQAAVPIHRTAGWLVVEDVPDPADVAPVHELPVTAESSPEQPARKRRRGIPDEESD